VPLPGDRLMAADVSAVPVVRTARVTTRARFGVLFRLFLRLQLTRVRVVLLLVAGLIGVLVALALHGASITNPEVGPNLISIFGLEMFVPVSALLLATATLGDMNEDGTLV